jgi:hypothetical protein
MTVEASIGRQVRCLYVYLCEDDDGVPQPRLVSAADNKRVKVFDGATGRRLQTLGGFDGAILTLTGYASTDGRQPRIAAGDNTGRLLVFDPEVGRRRKRRRRRMVMMMMIIIMIMKSMMV